MGNEELRRWERWGWERELYVPISWAMLGAGILILAGSGPLAGWRTLVVLPLPIALGMFPLVYGIVGRKIRNVRQSLADQDGEKVDCVIVNGWVQSPAVALRTDTELVFAPIVGKTVTVPLSALAKARATKWFNGRYLFAGKTGFWLQERGAERFGFMIAASVGARWRELAKTQDNV